jgi:multidrug efflux system membrane fusion protein
MANAYETRPPKEPPRPPVPQPAAPAKAPWRLLLIVAIVIALISAALLLARHKNQSAAAGKTGPQARGQTGPVSAVIGSVTNHDVPIYLDGLGTVQAFNTVTVRSRVDGQLKKIAFQEGQDVRTGDLLAQIDPDPFRTQMDQAEAKKAQDEAQLAFAQVELKRNADLLAAKIVSQEVYDTQKAQVNQVQAAVKADQAAIENARVQLNYATITSPIDGRAGIRQADEGNIIRANDTNALVVLTQLKPISLLFTLPEQSLREIQRHQTEKAMTVLAVDRDNSTILDEGHLAVIDNQIDTGTGTIRLKATFPNAKLVLWPGQFVNARLLLQVRHGPVVPASVVQRGPEGSYAFVVKDDMSVEMRKIKVGPIEKDQALIEDGLQPGELVVVDGQYKLQAGSKVRPAESPASESGRSNTLAETQGTSDRAAKKQKAADRRATAN